MSPEWGRVVPFSLSINDLDINQKEGNNYWVYHDPGNPPLLGDMPQKDLDDEYRWGFSLVGMWSSHLSGTDTTMVDISPASLGNITEFPSTFEEYKAFYNITDGGDISEGYDVNPKTGLPYQPQLVKRGDYARILAEFWADGPDSETPPRHWFTLLN